VIPAVDVLHDIVSDSTRNLYTADVNRTAAEMTGDVFSRREC